MIHLMTEEKYDLSTADDIHEILGRGKVVVIVECEDQGEPFSLEQLRKVHAVDKKVDVQGKCMLYPKRLYHPPLSSH
jgi:hypothetical protein